MSARPAQNPARPGSRRLAFRPYRLAVDPHLLDATGRHGRLVECCPVDDGVRVEQDEVGVRTRFDKTRPEIQAYAARLAATQDRVFATAGPGAELVYRYQYGLNGFAATMSPAQAHKLEAQPDVLQVWEDEIRPLTTNHSISFLGLLDADGGLRTDLGLDGEGIVIAIIDSGIAPEHPALQDTQEADRPSMCLGDWAENTFLGLWLCRRYDKRDDEVLFDPLCQFVNSLA